MNRFNAYREKLRELDDWFEFLLQECNLPGPRANIELAQAVAEEGTPDLFDQYLALDAERAPANTPHEYFAFCGILGLGRLLADGELDVLPRLKMAANDERWRIREGVALALQRWGKNDLPSLFSTVENWKSGSLLEKRAAVAAICEPGFLVDPQYAERALELLDSITLSLLEEPDHSRRDFKVLRQGLGYCWSVAVAALPTRGKPLFEHWCASKNPDILWIMKENLGKARMKNMDAAWTQEWQQRLGTK
jgi:hypothetical protein